MTESIKPPTWYWVVAGIALAWNLLGVMAFIMDVTMGEEAMAMMSPEEQEIYANTPIWATIAYAIAVFGGALGCVGLLMRKNFADLFFRASLAGIILQNINSWFFTNSWEVFGPGGAAMVALVIGIGIYLIVLAGKAKANQWTT